MNSHSEHRQRLKKRFIHEGLDNFEDYRALELLLFFSIPQKDTAPIAKDLLKYFGSISGVLDATLAQLQTVPGVGEHTAILLKTLTPMFRRYQLDKNDSQKILSSTSMAGEYISSLYVGEVLEIIYVLCFNQKKQLLCRTEIARGGYNSVPIDIRKIVEVALRVNAHSVILAHNHPQYWSIPSREDCYATEQLRDRLKSLGIILQDHVIASSDGYYSMKDNGLL